MKPYAFGVREHTNAARITCGCCKESGKGVYDGDYASGRRRLVPIERRRTI